MQIAVKGKWKARCFLLSLIVIATSLRMGAQTRSPEVPSLNGRVNDFANVLDSSTQRRIGTLLEGLRRQSQIEFGIVTVKNTGGADIFDYSQLLARDWGIGPNQNKKRALLLVVSVEDRKQFTQVSRELSGDLPDGLIGEMNRRMQRQFLKGQFSEGLLIAVQTVIATLGQRLAFAVDGVDQSYAYGLVTSPSPLGPGITSRVNSSGALTSANAGAVREAQPAASDSNSGPSKTGAVARTGQQNDRKPAAGALPEGEDEEEEVETTLALPAAERIEKLKSFIATHPKSAFNARALELMIGARAMIGDQQLKAGDSAGGIRQFRQALAESPLIMSDTLFNGVIAQIPLDLFVRDERAAAFDFARAIADRVKDNPKHLLALAAFYLRIEIPDEAARLANLALKLQPDLADAHMVLGSAYQIGLRLDDSAAEFSRTLELDPKSVGARRSLGDLRRASGKSEEALGLYREVLKTNPADKSARTGLVISLLDSGDRQAGEAELAGFLKEDPRNLSLLVGTAYWYAAHDDSKRALEFAKKAADLEPRYTWAHIALARALVGQKNPADAERALRFALQYGHYPTLDYELASTLCVSGLYTEAAEVLAHSFTFRDGRLETKLAGRVPASAESFLELLAPERRASIFQSVPADTESNSRMIKGLLAFADAARAAGEGSSDAAILAAAEVFLEGKDVMLPYRRLYVAETLLAHGLALPKVISLTDAVAADVETALNAPAATVAVVADNLREVRANAINAGGTPSIPDIDRASLSRILRGRIEEIAGWALLKSGRPADAVVRLRRAVSVFPDNSLLSAEAIWRLGAALDASGNQPEALAMYMQSYNLTGPDLVRRAVIEGLYRRINGNLDGLDQKLRAASYAAQGSTQNTLPAGNSGPSSSPPTPTSDSEKTTPQVPEARPGNASSSSAAEIPAPQPLRSSASSDAPSKDDRVTTVRNEPADDRGARKPSETAPRPLAKTPEIAVTSETAAAGRPSEWKFTVQVGSYKEPGQARERVAKLVGSGVEAKVLEVEVPNMGVWYRVQSGQFTTHEEASKFGDNLKERKIVLDFIVTEINAPR